MHNAHRKVGEEIVSSIETWAQQVGWKVLRGSGVEPELRNSADLVIDTGHGLVLVEAKQRDAAELTRVDVKTYPAGDRIYLIESEPGQWRFLTESNTFDPRPVSADGLRALVDEMLRSA